MVKSLFFCLCFISFFGTYSQNQSELDFHSSFEANHFSESDSYVAQLLMADLSVTPAEYSTFKAVIDNYLSTLKAKRGKFKTEKDFVSHIFYKTHRKFLKRYSQFTTFAGLMRSGQYDCLSATSLYSQLFTQLDLQHSIIETNYHIYLKVITEKGEILIESTDPIYGFVDSQKEIEKRLNEISDENTTSDDKNNYQFAADVNDVITPTELIGLQYYNLAVAAYNKHNYETAISLLTKGLVYRANSRNIEFGLVIAQSIMRDESLEQDKKLLYVSKLQRLFHHSQAVASR